ncbi:MAG: phosphoribosylanthranilate isomerase [Nitrincola lacisaponensis]|uniref:N-(5'-phosphoribosyl)anthranilate isomerase n=1 Tax=Nitrincola lacisaponensis TaxID=267850 RepID=A0A063Y0A5_9GAMM|nr:phosphoribosylanthranilate isomerase [Nitrincola lacisaponensis]KDE38600.1 Phosphoribosylanthranilate isomerase [Nitrincola lacisaponensis]
MRTRVKICGITRLEDALCAASLGADALGFVFYPPSPRYVAVEQAVSILDRLPAFVTSTALFVNATRNEVDSLLSATRIDLLQFHGDEDPDFCERFSRPYIKALRVHEGMDITAEAARYPGARAILLDAFVPGIPGGTGTRFDWQAIPRELAPRLVLAGGLAADNVAEAIREVQPFAVDVSGGVEAAKGIKDAEKIRHFMNEVNRVNAN